MSPLRLLLSSLGLAPARDVEHRTSEARRAAGKAEQLEQRLREARLDSENWKRRYEECAARVGDLKQAAQTAEQRARDDAKRGKTEIERIREELTRVRAKLEQSDARGVEWKARAETLESEVRELRVRLEEAQHAATMARDHLMATEVKIDLIEAAIHVLDARTRESAVSRT